MLLCAFHADNSFLCHPVIKETFVHYALPGTVDTVTNGIANVKISGDGIEFSKYSNFTILSFCLLNTKNEIMMPKGEPANHILAIKRISETY